ncbi:MAG: hypothetical protein BWZ07_03156 [Alphaproteobacteria bacterium ADurb.BinA280]|nr:MAG: hypothetical protein BWZ07_03156 [Alphaproteobacteria bacterium ADurb.BinA280]
MRRDDDAALGALLRLHVGQDFDTQPIGQAHVGDDNVKALCVQQLQGFLHSACRIDPIAFAQQREFIQRAQIGLIVDHKDLRVAQYSVGCHGVVVLFSEEKLSAGSTRRSVMTNSLPSQGCPRASRVVRWYTSDASWRSHNSRQM